MAINISDELKDEIQGNFQFFVNDMLKDDNWTDENIKSSFFHGNTLHICYADGYCYPQNNNCNNEKSQHDRSGNEHFLSRFYIFFRRFSGLFSVGTAHYCKPYGAYDKKYDYEQRKAKNKQRKYQSIKHIITPMKTPHISVRCCLRLFCNCNSAVLREFSVG